MPSNKKGYYKEYYKKNKKRLIRQSCLYVKNNRERVNAWQRNWLAKNRDRVNERRRKLRVKSMPFTYNSILTTIRILEKLQLEKTTKYSIKNQIDVIVYELKQKQLTAKKRKTWTRK